MTFFQGICVIAVMCLMAVGLMAFAPDHNAAIESCNGDFCGRGGFVMIDGEFTGERM